MNALRLLPLLLLAGCSTSFGPIGAPPTPTSSNPATVTVHRPRSIEGAALPMVFVIDGTEIYGLRNGENYQLTIDPGEYVFGWRLGLNTCDQTVWIRPARDIDLNFTQDCNIPPEP
jgi:hypothetical protein